MNIDDQETLIEEVIGFAREKLKSSHTLDFTIVAIDDTRPQAFNHTRSGKFATGDAKNELAEALRDEFRQKDIIRYVLIAECWVSRVAPMPSGPVTREYLDRHLAAYYDDYQKRELSPRKAGGREEVILLHVCDRMKSQIRIWSIARDPANGFITNLTRLPDDAASSEFDGRFINLLEGRAH